MFVIIGLGNPGKKYEHTRHNAGFLAVDKLREKYGFSDFKFNKKLNSEISELTGDLTKNEKVLLAKPQTFMNKSGEAVRAIIDFYKITPENILVIHDDLDIILGKYKMASDSSSAGHNGIQDIIEKIGTRNFKRIRIGIANETLRNPIDPSNFVLRKFSPEEMEILNGKISQDIMAEAEKFF